MGFLCIFRTGRSKNVYFEKLLSKKQNFLANVLPKLAYNLPLTLKGGYFVKPCRNRE